MLRIVPRLLTLSRHALPKNVNIPRNGANLQQLRHETVAVRELPEEPPEWYYKRQLPRRKWYVEGAADLIMFGMWYWVLYHCWYEYEHLTGHFTTPDPSKWTDEELGIPPDDE